MEKGKRTSEEGEKKTPPAPFSPFFPARRTKLFATGEKCTERQGYQVGNLIANFSQIWQFLGVVGMQILRDMKKYLA